MKSTGPDMGPQGVDLEPPSLWVQTVLYNATQSEIGRLVQGIRAAAAFARDRGAFRSIKLAFGDSSLRRSIDQDLEQELATTLGRYGIDGFLYHFFAENRGSARGQNSLFEMRDADVDYVFVMNPDVYLCPDVFCELLLPFEAADIGIVEARQLPLEHPKVFNPIDGTTSWASGACMMVRSDVLSEVKGFDGDSFFLYCDDVDFSWRTRLAGYRIIHQPTARVFHDKRLETDGRMAVSAAERYYAAEAALLMAWKYSRPDLVALWIQELLASSEPEHGRAVDAFRVRESGGTLPTPLDPEGAVAQFTGYYYGDHRYDVSV
jgi:hypothetical protein